MSSSCTDRASKRNVRGASTFEGSTPKRRAKSRTATKACASKRETPKTHNIMESDGIRVIGHTQSLMTLVKNAAVTLYPHYSALDLAQKKFTLAHSGNHQNASCMELLF